MTHSRKRDFGEATYVWRDKGVDSYSREREEVSLIFYRDKSPGVEVSRPWLCPSPRRHVESLYPAGGRTIHVLHPATPNRWGHGRMNHKDTKPYMSAFLSVDLLKDFSAFCLTDFIDWRYIHSWFVFSTQLVNCCPPGRRNYRILCTVAPLLYLLSDLLPPPLPNVQYIQTVCNCGWGRGGVEMYCTVDRSFTLCFWPDLEPTKLLHHPKQKWPVKTTLMDWCL